MWRRISDKADFAAGAALGGLIVGAGEGAYRGVSVLYAGPLYAALWALAGVAGVGALALLTRSQRHLGTGPFTWGLAVATAASALVLVRFVVLRDVMQEAASGRWKASAAGLVAAAATAGICWAIGRGVGTRRRRRDPGARLRHPWGWPAAALALFGFLTLAGDDPAPVPAETRHLEGSGVVLVVADTLRADVLGAYGAGPHRGAPATPRIDDFAGRALRFEDASAQASWTKPAVSTIMTSRHVSGHDTMAKPAILPPSLPTIASELQAAGIHTGAVVTNYNLEEGFGFARGFDHFEYLAPARYLGAPKTANKLAAYNVYRLLREKLLTSTRKAENFYRSGERVNQIGFNMLDELAADPDDRFFVWLHYMEPHDPYFANDGNSYARVSDPHPPLAWADDMRGAYRDDVRRFDRWFGELLDGLGARGLLDRTTVILMADHGEELGDHGGFYHGVTLYEEQLHVPLIISGPEVESGVDVRLARQVDIAPTVLGLFAHEAPPAWEGRDLFAPSAVPTVTIAEENHEGNVLAAVRYSDPARPLKLIVANPDNPRGLAPQELFDLGVDPRERAPMAGAVAVRADLMSALDGTRAAAKRGGASAGTRDLDEAAQAELRALGYVQ